MNEVKTETIKSVIGSILDMGEAQHQEDYGFLIEILDRFAEPDKIDEFERDIVEPLSWAMKACLKKKYPNANETRLAFVFTHHTFVECMVEQVIIQKEGTPCSVDKGGWLIRSYVDFLISGDIFSMDIPEKCFWKPRFGTSDEWIMFFVSLEHLFYGNPLKYLEALKIFMKPKEGDSNE